MAQRIEPSNPRSGPRQERVAAFKFGLSAESRAAMFLIAKGYRIAARRWKTPFGEIDIVARRRHALVFVEVKGRASASTTRRKPRRHVGCARQDAAARQRLRHEPLNVVARHGDRRQIAD
jgi:Holliday junction resolvase-like predicted endonuclease